MGPLRVRFTQLSDSEDDHRVVREDPEDDFQSELSELDDDIRAEPDDSDDDTHSEQADSDDEPDADSPDLSSSDSEHDHDGRTECERFEEEVEQRRQDKVLELREQTCIVQEQDSDTELPLQRKYSRDAPVISTKLAAEACSDLGVDGMLRQLNKVLRTAYGLDTPGLRHQLKVCIDRDYDFGRAYGRLRPYWHSPGQFPHLSDTLKRLEENDRDMRQDALNSETSRVQFDTPPRRIWDLYSNRVLPWWLVQQDRRDMRNIWAVSHSWVHVDKRHYPRSPVNERKWPVPLPKEIDKNLRRVRYELLNYGAEYAWLDVLCLRQEDRSKGGKVRNERVKKEEYKTDVPTIGYVYERPKEVVTYFSGLGLPFRAIKLDDERHWLKRAWTLQEIHPNPLIGGLTAKQQLTELKRSRSSKGSDVDEVKFFNALARTIDFAEHDYDVFDVLHRMRMRKAESELDRVCGMAYLLKSDTRSTLPTYETDEDAADAWYRLVRSIDRQYRAELFFLFPAEGTRKGHRWVPSWKQIQDADSLPNPGSQGVSVPKHKKDYIKYEHGAHRFFGLCIDGCRIEGLATASRKCRHGTLVVKQNRRHVRLAVTAHHQEPIPEEKDYSYMLLGTYDMFYWVVGRMTNSKVKKFKKVSVFRLEDRDDRARIQDLDLTSEISVALA